MQALNYPANLPLPTVGEQQRTKMSFKKLSGKAFDRVREGARIFFSGKSADIRGLGFVVEGIDRLDDVQLGAVVRELSAADQRGLEWQDKMKISLMRSTAEFSLQNRGFSYEGTAKPGTARKVLSGETIKGIMEQLGPDAAAMWRQIAQGLRVGPLAHGGKLPGGIMLQFDSEGWPMFFFPEGKSEPMPAFPQFQKSAEAQAPKSEREQAIEFLTEKLEPGDVLFVNKRSGKKTFISRGRDVLGRMAQAEDEDDEAFHAIHVMVYVGDGYVSHVESGGGKRVKLADLLRTKYNAVSVGRVGDKDKALKLSQASEAISGETKKYNFSEMYLRGVELMRRRQGQVSRSADPKKDAKICVDIVTLAAKEVGIPELSDARSALDIFKRMNIVYSMDVDNPRGVR